MQVKFLILRFSSIGDIVLTTPVIRCLKQQVEGEVSVHYITKKQFAPLLESNPYLDKVHVLQDNLQATIAELKAEQFDYIIDLHNNLRTLRIKRSLPALAFSFDKLNWQKWLLVNFKINKLPQVHIVDRYLETVKAFEVKNDGKGLDYFIPDKDVVAPAALDPALANGYVAFVIGGSFATKVMPEDKIVKICSGITLPVVLLGGKEDADRGKKIAIKAGAHVLNFCGKFNLNQSASLVQQAAKVITHDTGLMHIAAAFNKPIISIWGNTVPDFGMYPYLPRNEEASTVFEIKDLPCRPCSKLGHAKCPKKHFYCMNLIETDAVAEAANS